MDPLMGKEPTAPNVRVARGPALGWQPPAPTPHTPNKTQRNTPTYRVQPGDTLWSIAMAHHVDIFDLARWNNVDDPDKVVVGQPLYVRSPHLPLPQTGPDVMDEGSQSKAIIVDQTQPTRTVRLPQPSVVAQPDPMGLGHSGGFIKQKSFILPTSRKVDQAVISSKGKKNTIAQVVPVTNMGKAAPPPKSRGIQKKRSKTKPPSKQRRIVVRVDGSEHKKGIISRPKKVTTATAKANLSNIKKAPAPRRWRWPVKGKVVARFGKRGAKVNPGIDIAAQKGTPVVAPASGVVAYVGGHDSFGNLIIVNHGGRFKTLYAHNDVNLVERGQKIRAGQMIARVGNTGVRVRSPRLHFEIRKPIKPLNPLKYLSK
ncbi:peptidoglycan DD-metalloendopeptidase family protein [Magnetococcus sp. PR-3]|uniref:peptidoglycan DD-metalloendopeptidase family protein n=1 Tax=Magnetococcus sp. PR-3 TaxID=3120355 RepID=UPI002FCE45C3